MNLTSSGKESPMAKIGSVSEQNHQPEPPGRKPNEDYLSYWTGGSTLAAAVMDGIPVLRNADGSYPSLGGSIAAEIAARTITKIMAMDWVNEPALRRMKLAFRAANRRIGEENEEVGMYGKPESLWLSAVGCALWANVNTGYAVFAYIGDPFGFYLPRSGQMELLADDQLEPFQAHIREKHETPGNQLGSLDVRRHQDKFVRNNPKAFCWCGELLEGWGALTGEENAMKFLRFREFSIVPGDRFVLASDAVEVFGAGKGNVRQIEHYAEILPLLRMADPQQAAEKLLATTREREVEKNKTSDDATFVVVDI